MAIKLTDEIKTFTFGQENIFVHQGNISGYQENTSVHQENTSVHQENTSVHQENFCSYMLLNLEILEPKFENG